MSRLTPREHFGLELGRLRLTMLRFLREAAARRWIPAAHREGAWPWPSLQDAEAALQEGLPHGGGEATGEAIEARMAAQGQAVRERLAADGAEGRRLPLPQLVGAFGLSRIDLEVLLLAVAFECDPALRGALQLWRREPEARLPDVELASLLLGPRDEQGRSGRRSFDADAPLIAHALLELVQEPASGRTLFHAPSSVVRFILGDPACSDELAEVTRWLRAPVDPLAGVPEGQAAPVVARLTRLAADPRPEYPVAFFLVGEDGTGRRKLVRAAAARSGRPLLTVDLSVMARRRDQAEALLRRIRRDALLTGSLLHLHLPASWADPVAGPLASDGARPRPAGADDGGWAELKRAVQGQLASDPPLVVLTGPAGLVLFAETRLLAGERLRGLPPERAAALLGSTLSQAGVAPDALRHLPDEICRAGFPAGALIVAAREALLEGELGGPDVQDGPLLPWRAPLIEQARRRARGELDLLARRSTSPKNGSGEAQLCWEDLVVPPPVMGQLRDLLLFARHRDRVFVDWRFDERMPNGKAVTALFSGPTGVGKTLAARIVATQLCRPLYFVELARILSRYVGDTERRLADLFAAAQREQAVLLFDEADALFGARTVIASAGDRYANTTVDFLLQQLDTYEGMAILTTNHEPALDPAVLGRLRFKVRFPFPDLEARERLWSALLPAAAPLRSDIDFRALAARFSQLGGARIRNAILRAALRCAGAGEPIGFDALCSAAAEECDSPPPSEVPRSHFFSVFPPLARQGDP
ncbi:MAG: ATP-binding protein [Myxococcaceae bacterium]|nr:ATP-binding protein [Myxococcaceae bacterium]